MNGGGRPQRLLASIDARANGAASARTVTDSAKNAITSAEIVEEKANCRLIRVAFITNQGYYNHARAMLQCGK